MNSRYNEVNFIGENFNDYFKKYMKTTIWHNVYTLYKIIDRK